jgi:hypothetical protein
MSWPTTYIDSLWAGSIYGMDDMAQRVLLRTGHCHRISAVINMYDVCEPLEPHLFDVGHCMRIKSLLV